MDKYIGEDIAEAMNDAISVKHGGTTLNPGDRNPGVTSLKSKKKQLPGKKPKVKDEEKSTADPVNTAK